jgi:4-coumarate--CoA ligase
LTKELVEGVWERFKIPVKQGYGLSETSPVATCQTVDEFGKCMGSVGKLIPNMEAKIIDEDGSEVMEGEVGSFSVANTLSSTSTNCGIKTGELLLKGPNVFQGYLNRPELNKDIFTADGYFKTGDIGHRDSKGNYYITDRAKELIKYSKNWIQALPIGDGIAKNSLDGFQVAPAELEGALVAHPDIVDACVIGVWDTQRQTEVPRAYIVVKPGTTADDALAANIVTWLSKQLAAHKRLRGGIRFIDGIPKSAAGKILRRILKDGAKREGEPKSKL